MLGQIYANREKRTDIRIKYNPDIDKLDCERIIICGVLPQDDTFHVLSEISSSTSSPFLDSQSIPTSLKLHPYKLSLKQSN